MLQAGSTSAPDSDARAASVLLDRFETVFQAQAELLAKPGDYGRWAKDDADLLRFPFDLLLAGLNEAGPDAVSGLIGASASVLVGARDFAPPEGLGGVHSLRCYVLVLRGHTAPEVDGLLKNVPSAPGDAGPVWSWYANLHEFGELDSRPTSMFALQVGASYVLVANSASELAAVAERLRAPGKADEPAPAVNGWSGVKANTVWAYRKYRATRSANEDAAGTSVVSPHARDVLFVADAGERGGLLRLRGSADDETAGRINAIKILPPLRPVQAGTWETTIPLRGDAASEDHLVCLMALLGFGMYL